MGHDIGKGISLLYKQAVKARQPQTAKWNRALKWFKGEQKIRERSSKRANTVTNYLFSQVMTIIPMLADRFPEINAKPVDENNELHIEQGKSVTEKLNRIYRRNNIHVIQAQAVTNSHLFGKAFYKVTWDNDARTSRGDVKIEVPDTRTIFMEPGKMWARESNYILEAQDVDRLTLMRQYPEKKTKIKDLFEGVGKQPPESLDAVTETDMLPPGENAGAPDRGVPTPGTSQSYVFDHVMAGGGKQKRQRVELIQAWFRDDETVMNIRDVLDIDGKTVLKSNGKPAQEEVEEQAFPTGRMAVVAQAELFDDKKNPFPAFPYIELINYYIPGEQWSMGELENAMPIQEQFNIRQNQIFDFFNFNIAPIRLYDRRSGLKAQNLSNNPSQWIPVNSTDGVRELGIPRMSLGIFESLGLLRTNLETIFGVREVTQGAAPGDVRSGAAIEFLQEAAQVRLRLKTRYLEFAIKEMSQFITRIMSEFYVPGVHYGEGEVSLADVDPDDFDYEVKAGTNLPSSRAAEQLLIQWMFTNQIIDEQYVVENSQLPGKENLISRMTPIWEQRRALLEQQVPPQQGGQPIAA